MENVSINQCQRAWRLKQLEGMVYKSRQAYVKIKHANREARQLEATLPQCQATEQLKQKNQEWKGKAGELLAVYRKRAKLLQREKNG
jgi:hypothetical protein